MARKNASNTADFALFGADWAASSGHVAPTPAPIAPAAAPASPVAERATTSTHAPVESTGDGPQLMPLKDWAKRNGIGWPAALNHIKRGVIVYADAGRKLVDVEKCDALLRLARVNVGRPKQMRAAGEQPRGSGGSPAPERPAQQTQTPQDAAQDLLAQQAIDLAAAKLRKATADAAAAELRTARARGDLIPRNAVLARVEQLAANIRAPLLSMAGRLGPVLASTGDPVACTRMIREEVERTLQACADGLPDWGDTDG